MKAVLFFFTAFTACTAQSNYNYKRTSQDGKAYTLKEFVDYFGGTMTNPPVEWKNAPVLSTDVRVGDKVNGPVPKRNPSERYTGTVLAVTCDSKLVQFDDMNPPWVTLPKEYPLTFVGNADYIKLKKILAPKAPLEQGLKKDEKLRLMGLRKQVDEGDFQPETSADFSMLKKAPYKRPRNGKEAHASLKGTCREEATRLYVSLATQLVNDQLLKKDRVVRKTVGNVLADTLPIVVQAANPSCSSGGPSGAQVPNPYAARKNGAKVRNPYADPYPGDEYEQEDEDWYHGEDPEV